MTLTAQPLEDYVSALDRLKSGKPPVVPKGTLITNDAVSLEAGRGKGSIKKSRAVFADLILAIEVAAEAKAELPSKDHDKLLRSKSEGALLRTQLEAALARELSLLKELYEVKKRLQQLTGEKIVPIRSRTALPTKGPAHV